MTDTTEQQAVTVAHEADEAHRLASVLRIAQAYSDEHGEDLIKAAGMLDRLVYLPAITRGGRASSANAEKVEACNEDGSTDFHRNIPTARQEALAAMTAMDDEMALPDEPLTASPEPVPATNQAGEVELVIAALRAERAKPLQGPEHGAWDRGRRYGLDDAIRIVVTLATQPATSQEGEERARKVLADARIAAKSLFGDCPDDVAISAMLTFAATPTPPTVTSQEGEEALYSQWLASGGCDDAPTITREQHLRFQSRIDQETRSRSDSWANTPEAEHERILLMAEIELHLKSCRIFLTTREKMHPVGVDIHDELLAKVTAAIEATGSEKAHG